jgi:hypothetical protein
MRIFLTILFLLGLLPAAAQNVGGLWRGYATENETSRDSELELEITHHTNETITGRFSWYYEGRRYYQHFTVEGEWRSRSRALILYEVKLDASFIPPQEVDCFGILTLRYSRSGRREQLEGTWENMPMSKSPCLPCKLYFERGVDKKEKEQPLPPVLRDTAAFVPPLQRRSELFKTIAANADTVRVDIYDNATIDDDSVTVIFNDKIILRHQRLSDRPVTLYLPLLPGGQENKLQLSADNLGSIPPNTALLIIRIGDKRYELRVSAGLNSNAAVVFRRE